MTDQNNVTGRDGYIIAKALLWALKYAETLPEDQREWSDEEDMRQILTTRFAAQRDFIEGEETPDHPSVIGFSDVGWYDVAASYRGHTYTATYVIEEGNIQLAVKLGRRRHVADAPVGDEPHLVVAERLLAKVLHEASGSELFGRIGIARRSAPSRGHALTTRYAVTRSSLTDLRRAAGMVQNR